MVAERRIPRPVPSTAGRWSGNMERGLIHISTGWDTPRPRTPTPHYRHLFERGRGGLTTNGIHSILPLGLSNQPGPPPPVLKGELYGPLHNRALFDQVAIDPVVAEDPPLPPRTEKRRSALRASFFGGRGSRITGVRNAIGFITLPTTSCGSTRNSRKRWDIRATAVTRGALRGAPRVACAFELATRCRGSKLLPVPESRPDGVRARERAPGLAWTPRCRRRQARQPSPAASPTTYPSSSTPSPARCAAPASCKPPPRQRLSHRDKGFDAVSVATTPHRHHRHSTA